MGRFINSRVAVGSAGGRCLLSTQGSAQSAQYPESHLHRKCSNVTKERSEVETKGTKIQRLRDEIQNLDRVLKEAGSNALRDELLKLLNKKRAEFASLTGRLDP